MRFNLSLFFLSFFIIYGGMHLYAFLRTRSAFALGLVASAALALFMLLMIFSLFLVRTLEQYGYEISARAFAYLAYFWMAALFLYFCSSLLFDLAGLATRSAGRLTGFELSAHLVPARTAFLVSAGLSLILCLYGYFEAQNIRTERVRIETAKLPAGTDRLTIVQISDVHLGLIVRGWRLAKMLNIVKSEKPDIFISTGDLVDAQINHLEGLAEQLSSVGAPYGNYAVTGNHEYYAGLDKALDFTRRAGFRVIRNEVVEAGPITLAGVDDRTAVQLNLARPLPEKELLEKLPRDRFTLFLKHQPRMEQSSFGLFDLQLSGHTHKGQIFPFTLLVWSRFPMIAGDYDLGKGSRLHVSRGTGTWGPPIRFLSPPEVTVVELVRKAS